MYADELKTVFHRDGFTLTGFVGPDPDSKEDKLYTLSDLHKLSTVFDDGQLHAGKTTIDNWKDTERRSRKDAGSGCRAQHWNIQGTAKDDHGRVARYLGKRLSKQRQASHTRDL